MTSTSLLVTLLPLLLAIVIGILRRDLIRIMFWAGLLAIPVLLSSPLSFHYLEYPLGLMRLVSLFAFGAIAAAGYETIFGKYFKLKGRSRKPLIWMLAGPVIFLVGTIISGQTVGPLIFTLLFELLIVLTRRKDLIWDVLFSGGAMAILYTLLLIVLVRLLGSPLGDSWLVGSLFSGLTVWGIPVEEVVVVALFGALWGPMYPAFKDLKLTS